MFVRHLSRLRGTVAGHTGLLRRELEVGGDIQYHI